MFKAESRHIIVADKHWAVIQRLYLSDIYLHYITHLLCTRIIKMNRYDKWKYHFDKLPQAVSYLTEQVIELKQMVSALQPTSSANNHILVEIDEAAIIIMKSKPTIYRLVNQGILPSYKKGKKLYFYKDELLAWIENGRKATKEQNHSEMLKAMQGGMKRKPKSMYNF